MVFNRGDKPQGYVPPPQESQKEKFRPHQDRARRSRASSRNNPCRWKRRLPVCTSRKDLAEGIVYGKVGVIENVEKFPSELQGSVIAQLLDRYILSERKIQIKVTRARQKISSRSSQESSVLECKRSRVEVAVRPAQDDVLLVASRHEIRVVDISGPLPASAGVHT